MIVSLRGANSETGRVVGFVCLIIYTCILIHQLFRFTVMSDLTGTGLN